MLGLSAPLIGRDAELARMVDSLDLACGGAAQLVRLVGEAGIGKTRLVNEFVARVAMKIASQAWRSGASSARRWANNPTARSPPCCAAPTASRRRQPSRRPRPSSPSAVASSALRPKRPSA